MKRIATIVALICAVTFQVNAQNTESEILNFDPLLQWGCSIADVEQHMQQKEWWTDGNDKLEYWEDPYQCWHRWYFVDKAELVLTEQYLFETKDGQRREVHQHVDSSGLPLQRREGRVRQRYIHALPLCRQ